MKLKIATLILIIFSLYQCSKPPQYPSQPQIDFLQISVKDTVDILDNVHSLYEIAFKILDGDGDFGFKDKDTNDTSTNFNNFLIDIYIKKNNIITKITNDTISYNGKIPWIKPVGLNTYYKSTVFFNLDIYSINYDSIQFKFFVLDRAKNKSNTETTMWIAKQFRGTLYDNNDLIAETN